MPYKAKSCCAHPGCPEPADGRYCPKHAAMMREERNQRRDPALRQRFDRHWHKLRDLYIAKHPLCEECEKAGRLVPATEVHHIVPFNNGGTDADKNLQALCKSCHSRHTMEENRKRVY